MINNTAFSRTPPPLLVTAPLTEENPKEWLLIVGGDPLNCFISNLVYPAGVKLEPIVVVSQEETPLAIWFLLCTASQN